MAERAFGDGDATFQALGRESGIRGLVESFYRIMDSAQEAERIRERCNIGINNIVGVVEGPDVNPL